MSSLLIKEESTSFLKKRNKKLLLNWSLRVSRPRIRTNSFWVLLFKKELLSFLLLAAPFAAQADTVRAAVGKPVEQAQALIRAGDYAAALAMLRKAAAVPDRTPYENLVIAELRGSAAAGAGDDSQAAGAYQAALATGAVPAAQQTQFVQAIAGFYLRAGDTADSIIWLNKYIAAGGTDEPTRALLAQTYYQTGDYAKADHAAAADISAQVKSGQKPLESEWQLLASAAEKTGDQPGYQTALQGLLTDDPRPQYWAAAIDELLAAPNFPDRLTLDVYRLRRATGTLTAPGDYEDYAERAILAGHPDEAKAVLADGFAKNILSAQTDSGHAARLRALVDQTGPASANILPASSSGAGAAPDRLDQGIAAFDAGQLPAARADFVALSGAGAPNTPDAALAQLWALRATQP
jgi:hypothetical protein